MPIPAHVNVLEVGETARLISFQVKKGRCSAEGVWSMTVDKSLQARGRLEHCKRAGQSQLEEPGQWPFRNMTRLWPKGVIFVNQTLHLFDQFTSSQSIELKSESPCNLPKAGPLHQSAELESYVIESLPIHGSLPSCCRVAAHSESMKLQQLERLQAKKHRYSASK